MSQAEVEKLALLLGSVRYRYASEAKLHDVIELLLKEAGIVYTREYRIDAQNRADFWINGIVIEVKVDGTAGDALRQVDRYIRLEGVHGVLLAATPMWASTQIKARPQWGGKAFAMVRLQRQAL